MLTAMIANQEAVLDLHPEVGAKVADAIEAEAEVTLVHPVVRPVLPEAQRSKEQIVVEKLTKNVTEAHLREIFGSFGDIEHLELPMNRAFMTNRGTAYIIYYDPADAEAAIAHMHEAQLDGAVLNVSIILPRRAFSRSPPPAANRGNGRGRFGKGSFANSLRDDMVVLDLPRDMIHTDLNHDHGRDPLFDLAHILVSSLHQEEEVPETKARDSADDEALATAVAATVVAVSGAGAQTEVAAVAVAAIGAE
ncbi:hypothetical protein N7493_002984 [Penicillium malachiteum]|uniref:RRM domain-containing protein n=1 Tax=Penicillium malachiteum TaxID=1324776 RepID=A0AAD6HSW0_9EURO|nr:hypothetical protein N7493_002984 [Penicillium malachiteum]